MSVNQFVYQVGQFGKIIHWSENDIVNISLWKTEWSASLWRVWVSRNGGVSSYNIGCDDWGETWPAQHWWALVHGAKLEKSFFCQGRMSKTSKISSVRKEFFRNVLLLLCVSGYCGRSGPRYCAACNWTHKERKAFRVGLSWDRYFAESGWRGRLGQGTYNKTNQMH